MNLENIILSKKKKKPDMKDHMLYDPIYIKRPDKLTYNGKNRLVVARELGKRDIGDGSSSKRFLFEGTKMF